ncbi:hypothetical protein [Caldimonas brevitalea]|uniref:Uncharacterized protein n=1 Tax=Caldimonas brevitalea TaxID=413882 RepID=A0A0G3BV18_9BURK|nr:hypothetical protein [Caldimonas brevitalea]AKJ31843.1 hypothetical protein AAW51_5152 [Caldimonas brevitalea]
MTAPTSLNPAQVHNYVAMIETTYRQQGAAAAARQLREVTQQQTLTQQDKQAIYNGVDDKKVVAGIADDLGKHAHTDFGKQSGDATAGPIDTQAEYVQATADMAGVFENTQDSGEARSFSQDVLDSIQVPAGARQDPQARLGLFGQSLKGDLKQNNTQLLIESVAFSLTDPKSGNGVFQLSGAERKATVDGLLKTVEDTPLNDLEVTIEDGDTLWAVAANGDVQRRMMTPGEWQRAETENWSADRRTRFVLDRLETENGYHRNLDDGHATSAAFDPDTVSRGDKIKVTNHGTTLAVDTGNTAGQAAPSQDQNVRLDPIHQGASNIATAYHSDPGRGVALYQDLTRDMTADQKAEMNRKLLEMDGRAWGEDMLKAMGVSDPQTAKLLAGRAPDPKTGKPTGRSNVEAVYKVYVAQGGDPSKFIRYLNEVSQGGTGKVEKLVWGAQGVMAHAKDGKPLQHKDRDGAQHHNWDNTTALIDPRRTTPPESVSGFKSMMRFFDIKPIPT